MRRWCDPAACVPIRRRTPPTRPRRAARYAPADANLCDVVRKTYQEDISAVGPSDDPAAGGAPHEAAATDALASSPAKGRGSGSKQQRALANEEEWKIEGEEGGAAASSDTALVNSNAGLRLSLEA